MKDKIGKYVLSAFFLFFIGLIGIKSIPMKALEESFSIETIKKAYADSIYLKSTFLNQNSEMLSRLNLRGLYNSSNIWVTETRNIVGQYPITTTDYEYTQILDFKEYLDEKNINLLYANLPVKYVDDSVFEDEFGIKSYSNYNADLFLSRISNAGITSVDLRNYIQDAGMEISNMFYRTDHHWTTESGLWATNIVAESLNKSCGYDIDTSIYDFSNFRFTEYKKCWLGEQGRKLGAIYSGWDDYTLIEPKFNTSFLMFRGGENIREGNFDIMLDKSRLPSDVRPYTDQSLHYTYSCLADSITVHNNDVNKGKVLLLADSYAAVVVPFLSLGVSDVTTILRRSYGGRLRELIDKNDFDTVVIMYAQFMIGAHDNPESSNYNMFKFE